MKKIGFFCEIMEAEYLDVAIIREVSGFISLSFFVTFENLNPGREYLILCDFKSPFGIAFLFVAKRNS